MTGAPLPVPTRAAVGVWFALAAFGLLNVGYLWFRRAAVEEAAVRDGYSAESVGTLLAQLTVVAVGFAVGYAVFGSLLRRGRRWARGALTAVAVPHVLWAVLPGASAASLVVVALIAAGLAFTWHRGTAEWLKQQH